MKSALTLLIALLISAPAIAQSTGARGIIASPGPVFPQPECKARPARYDPHNSEYYGCHCPKASAWGPLDWVSGGSAGRGYCQIKDSR